MTPEERQLLAGLFDRVKGAAGGERDKEAEDFIASAMKDAPHSGYVLSQAVIVQEEALKAAAAKIEELESQVQELEEQAQNAPPAAASGGFLGGMGKSLFGGDQREEPRRAAASGSERPFGQRSAVPSSRSGVSVPPPPGASAAAGGSPWSHKRNAAPGQEQQPASGGNSFLKGALGAAAGVAGGVLLANAIGGLFSGNNNPLGINGAKAAENSSGSGDKSSGDDWQDDKSSGDDWEDDEGDDWDEDEDKDEGDDWDGGDDGDDWE